MAVEPWGPRGRTELHGAFSIHFLLIIWNWAALLVGCLPTIPSVFVRRVQNISAEHYLPVPFLIPSSSSTPDPVCDRR